MKKKAMSLFLFAALFAPSVFADNNFNIDYQNWKCVIFDAVTNIEYLGYTNDGDLSSALSQGIDLINEVYPHQSKRMGIDCDYY